MKATLVLLVVMLVWSGHTHGHTSIVEQRQALFEQIEVNTEQLEDLVSDTDWQKSKQIAQALSLDVQKLSALFPSSTQGEGRSKTRIWQDWRHFESKLQVWSEYYQKVAEASADHNAEQATLALDKANSACRSCHMKYRSLW